MQVTETHSEGLKREFKVILPAGDLATRMDGQLNEIREKAHIKGFRPGKVPVAHLRRLYGRSIMVDVVQEAVSEANRKIVADNNLRLAGEPKLDFGDEPGAMEKTLEAQGDLAFTVAVELLPKVEVGPMDDIAIEKLVADVPDEEVDSLITRLAEQGRPYTLKAEGETAANGDRVTIDFVGRIDGEAFQGGSGTDVDLSLGSNSFIPGFEDQVVGIATGETRTISVDFPADYGAAELAGKAAQFEVTAKTIQQAGELAITDELAKGFGFDDLAALRASVRSNIEREYGAASRTKWKRALLDALDKRYTFDLPQGLVDQEFEAIWRQVEAEQAHSGKGFADEDTTEEDARVEYRGIAERRVRLGLVLAEIGEAAGVKITEEELNRALMERARQYPGEEQKVWEFFRKNPQAMAQIQAPLFEDKVVDHIAAQATVTERKVTKAELTAEDPEPGDAAADVA